LNIGVSMQHFLEIWFRPLYLLFGVTFNITRLNYEICFHFCFGFCFAVLPHYENKIKTKIEQISFLFFLHTHMTLDVIFSHPFWSKKTSKFYGNIMTF